MQDEKQQLRRSLRRARRLLGKTERRAAALNINRRLKKLLKRNRRMAVYWPVGSELRLDGLVAAAAQRGTELYLPYIETRRLRLWFTPYVPQQKAERSRKGRFGIPQFAGKKVRAERLDVMLLPLVGIDRSGYRLGQGGGFYDASLAHSRFGKPLKIGVGFACQMVEKLPHEAHDKRLDGFVCEIGAYRF